jgi:translation initiation factor 1
VKRIDTSGRQEALQSPFAGLQMEGLPEGPAEISTVAVAGKPGRIILRRETAQRGGKSVVVVTGFEERHTASDIGELARAARQACGCGGTVRGREIELQGNLLTEVRRFFEARGFRVAGEK